MASENGWEPLHAGPDILEWITVPGTSVSLQLMKGWPSTIMRAYAADYNAFVEPLRDEDSAGFTPTNSVATSNHLNGTAMDLNWNSHPFQVADAGYSPHMIDTMKEILAFYEDTMWWANNWDDPKDAMHHQMGYNTWNNPHTGDFITRKIRPDGYSTFRRGNTAPQLSPKDQYALAIIGKGRELGITDRGIEIALATTLVETNLTMYANSNVPASLGYPHDAVGSDHDSTGLFQQRQAWGPLSSTMDPAGSAELFFNGGQSGQRGLTDFDYNSNTRTPGGWAQAVQVSAFPDRYDGRFGEATQIFDRLKNYSGGENWTPSMNQLVGGDNPMATADDVDRQLDDPSDKITTYEGAGFAHQTWSVRDWTRTLNWDLTRFQSPKEARFKADPTAVWGLRDAVTSLQREVDMNNRLLKRLCDKAGISYTDLD